MGKLFGFSFVVLLVGGAIAVPTYNYSHEEKQNLKERQHRFGEQIFWFPRAYQRWKLCGSMFSMCDKDRCAAFRNGCRGSSLTHLRETSNRNFGKPSVFKPLDPSLDTIGRVTIDLPGDSSPRKERYNPDAHKEFQKWVENRKSNPKLLLDRKKIKKGEKAKSPWGTLTPPKEEQKPGYFGTAQEKPKPKRKRGLDVTTYRNDSFGAYTQALKEGKYTVIHFGSEYCGFCKNMVKKLTDPALVKYDRRVIVSDTDQEKDLGAKQLEEALGVVRYPTLVVLKTNNKNIHVAGRIEGEVSVADIDRIFQEATKDPIGK